MDNDVSARSHQTQQLVMRKVRVVSKKYDGSLRDEYETYLYSEEEVKKFALTSVELPPRAPAHEIVEMCLEHLKK